MALGKSELLAVFAAKVIAVEVAGVGEVRLRELSATEVSNIRAAAKGGEDADFGVRLAIASLVDEQDQPVFAESDLVALRGSAQGRFGEVVGKILEINGFTSKADAAKN